jgi:hypothetical protein
MRPYICQSYGFAAFDLRVVTEPSPNIAIKSACHWIFMAALIATTGLTKPIALPPENWTILSWSFLL